MKHTIILALAIIFNIISLSAQDSKEIISEVSAKMNSFECVELTFSFTALDDKGAVMGEQSGIFIVQGDKFVVLAPQISVYCDGESKWIYDKDNAEVTIIKNDPTKSDITENPFNIFKSAEDVYNFPSKPSEEENGCRTIFMVPKDKKINYSSVEFKVNMSDYTPVSLKYISKSGETYFAQIDSLRKIEPKDDKFFIIDIDSLWDVIVTDLR